MGFLSSSSFYPIVMREFKEVRKIGAGKMAQLRRAPVANVDDQSLIPRNHVMEGENQLL